MFVSDEERKKLRDLVIEKTFKESWKLLLSCGNSDYETFVNRCSNPYKHLFRNI
jgi:hypothetical protein